MPRGDLAVLWKVSFAQRAVIPRQRERVNSTIPVRADCVPLTDDGGGIGKPLATGHLPKGSRTYFDPWQSCGHSNPAGPAGASSGQPGTWSGGVAYARMRCKLVTAKFVLT